MATNMLADHLASQEGQGLPTEAVAADKKSKFTYRLAEKGMDTVPVLIEPCLGVLSIAPLSWLRDYWLIYKLIKMRPWLNTNSSPARPRPAQAARLHTPGKECGYPAVMKRLPYSVNACRTWVVKLL